MLKTFLENYKRKPEERPHTLYRIEVKMNTNNTNSNRKVFMNTNTNCH